MTLSRKAPTSRPSARFAASLYCVARPPKFGSNACAMRIKSQSVSSPQVYRCDGCSAYVELQVVHIGSEIVHVDVVVPSYSLCIPVGARR